MASVYKRGTGWRVQIRNQNTPGLSKTFQLKSHAQIWARETERQLESGALPLPPVTAPASLGDALERYQREVSPHKRGHDSERYRLAKILRHPICRIELGKLRSSDLASYRDHRAASVSASSVRKELQLLSHALDIATNEWGAQLSGNPVKAIRKPHEQAGRKRRLNPEEQPALLKAAGRSRNRWLRPLVEFALETAMRRGELLTLNWADADIQRRVVSLRMTKNGRSRELPLSAKALTILAQLPQERDGRVFALTKEALRRTWQTACRKAGIENLHFHDLRHEATSRLFEKGLSIMEVASITGHRDLRMLQRYTHLRAEELAKKLD